MEIKIGEKYELKQDQAYFLYSDTKKGEIYITSLC